MTVVQPHLQWGVAEIGADQKVEGFVEKPRSEHWINGGFFCFEPGALDYIDEDSVLEREPLERLAGDGQLRAYRHEGFWDCMDTYKDAVVLNDLWPAASRPGGLGQRPRRAVRRALVTGGHGFVASHLVGALLARGDEVRVLDGPIRASPTSAVRGSRGSTCSGLRGEVELVEGDLRDAEAVAAAVDGCDVGLPPRRADDRRRRPRARRWRRLKSTCAAPGTSSRPVASTRVGESSSPPPTRPTAPAPSCPTARTFRCAPPTPTTPARRRPTSIARSYARAYGLPLAVTRFANIYGGGDLNFSRLIPETAIAVLDGRPPRDPLRRQPERDFLHVDDAVAAYLGDRRGARPAAGPGERPSTPAASARTRCARWST